MRRVVIISMVVLMVGCVGLVVAAMIFGPQLVTKLMETSRDNVAQVMQDSLYQSSVEAIESGDAGKGEVWLRDRDLSVNNTVAVGEVGWESGTSGTVVYGFDLWITPEGLSLGIEGEPMYSGVPTIVAGRLELTDVQAVEDSFLAGALSEEGFEHVIEEALNDALAARDLAPTSLLLRDGVMILEVVSEPQSSPLTNTAKLVAASSRMHPRGVAPPHLPDGA